jgi:hypothetical protein
MPPEFASVEGSIRSAQRLISARNRPNAPSHGFEDLVEAVSVPAEAMTVPPPEVVPPEDAAEVVTRYGNEILG